MHLLLTRLSSSPQKEQATLLGSLLHLLSRPIICILLLCALWTIHKTAKDRQARMQEETFGRFTAKQIMDKSDEISVPLLHSQYQYQVRADRCTAISSKGPVRYWTVDYTSSFSSDSLHLRWFADTGELCSLDRPLWMNQGNAQKVDLTAPEQAVQCTNKYLAMFTREYSPSDWKLSGYPQRLSGVWRVEWMGKDRQAAINIDARTGDLISAACHVRMSN